MYGNAERRTQPGASRSNRRQARTDVWMMLEVFQALRCANVGARRKSRLKARASPTTRLPDVIAEAAKMGYTPESTLYEVLFARPENRKFRLARCGGQGARQRDGQGTRRELVRREGAVRGVPAVHGELPARLAPFDVYYGDTVRGCAGRWCRSTAGWQETKWRFSEGNDPYVKKGEGFNFYGGAFKALPPARSTR